MELKRLAQPRSWSARQVVGLIRKHKAGPTLDHLQAVPVVGSCQIT